MLRAFRERHDFVWSALNAMPGVRCIRAAGAFYAYPYVGEAIEALHASGRIAQATDLAFSAYLLEKALVAVVPGSAFGTEGYVRISFATSMQNLEKAMARITEDWPAPTRTARCWELRPDVAPPPGMPI